MALTRLWLGEVSDERVGNLSLVAMKLSMSSILLRRQLAKLRASQKHRVDFLALVLFSLLFSKTHNGFLPITPVMVNR